MPAQIGVAQQVHPIKDLIGGPLQAIVEAHTLLAQSTLQFLSEVGFEPVDGGNAPARLRMLEFSYLHPVPDPANPGNVIDTPAQVKVPLLAMVPMPSLRISEANLDFNIKVVGFSQVKGQENKSKVERAGLPFTIQGVYTTRAPVAERLEPEPSTLSISIKITKEPVPEGINRVLNLLDDAMIARPREQSSEPSSPKSE